MNPVIFGHTRINSFITIPSVRGNGEFFFKCWIPFLAKSGNFGRNRMAYVMVRFYYVRILIRVFLTVRSGFSRESDPDPGNIRLEPKHLSKKTDISGFLTSVNHSLIKPQYYIVVSLISSPFSHTSTDLITIQNQDVIYFKKES